MAKFSFKKLGDDLVNASVAAMNRAARSAVTAVNRFIRQKYNIKASVINERMKIVARASKSQPYVKLRITKGAIPLYDFNAKQIGKGGRSKNNKGPRFNHGVKATVEKGKRKLFRSQDRQRGAFIATMKSGHTGVFIRQGNVRVRGASLGFGGGYKLQDKDKIQELHGVDLASLVVTKTGNRTVLEEMEKKFHEEYEKRLTHELNRKYKRNAA